MKPTVLLLAGCAALALAACDSNGAPAFGPPAMKTVSKLNCQQSEGRLRRVSVAPDGKSCRYTDDDGDEVTLQLVSVSGSDVDAALRPIEDSLKILVPDINAKAPEATAGEAATDKAVAKDVAAAEAAAASDAGVDAAGVDDDHDGVDINTDEDVDVNMPGVHVKTRGDKADVNVLGIHINANDKDDTVHIRRQPKTGVGNRFAVDANDNGAIVRMEGGNKANVKSTVFYAMDNAGPQGDRMVGYVVRGPRSGPVVVATIRSKRENDGDHTEIHGGVFDDATKLVRKAFRG
jgi:hypothetical protein